MRNAQSELLVFKRIIENNVRLLGVFVKSDITLSKTSKNLAGISNLCANGDEALGDFKLKRIE
jgi:hypothetical protein